MVKQLLRFRQRTLRCRRNRCFPNSMLVAVSQSLSKKIGQQISRSRKTALCKAGESSAYLGGFIVQTLDLVRLILELTLSETFSSSFRRYAPSFLWSPPSKSFALSCTEQELSVNFRSMSDAGPDHSLSPFVPKNIDEAESIRDRSNPS